MNITIIGMVYRSLSYLDFMARGMLATTSFDGHDGQSRHDGHNVTPLIVANNATPEIIERLEWMGTDGVEWLNYRDRKPSDYYLNRVYRAWNAGAKAAESADVIVFVNSDMWPHDEWLERLIARLDRNTIPCSRLIESGKLQSGRHAIEHYFGSSPETFDQTSFERYAAGISQDRIEPGGLFMPCAFYRDDFLAAGGYPEGNIYSGGVVGQPVIGKPSAGRVIESGDAHFFRKMGERFGYHHVTVFDSLVFHIQTGEMDE